MVIKLKALFVNVCKSFFIVIFKITISLKFTYILRVFKIIYIVHFTCFCYNIIVETI